jgi:hypothetical protein
MSWLFPKVEPADREQVRKLMLFLSVPLAVIVTVASYVLYQTIFVWY